MNYKLLYLLLISMPLFGDYVNFPGNGNAGGGSGDVIGATTSTDNALVRWDGATGKLIQNSTAVLSDAGLLNMGITGDIEIEGPLNYVEFGSGIAGKAVNAGRISYANPTADTLDIYGGGDTLGDLGIKLWDDVTVNDDLTVTGDISSASISVASTTKASHPYPNMTDTEMLALTGMNVGDRIFNTTAFKPYTYGGVSWYPDTLIIEYQAGFPFVKGDYIITKPRNFLYQAVNDFVATTVGEDLVTNMEFVAPGDWTTSIISGGLLTSPTPGDYEVAAGSGIIVRNNNTQFPTYNTLAWPLATFSALPNPTGWNTVFIDNTAQDVGVVNVVPGTPTPEFAKLNIMIGVIYAPTNYFQNIDIPSLDAGGTVRTLSLFVGLMKRELNFSGLANREFFTSSGQIYYPGISGFTEEPNLRDCPVQTITSFSLYDQDTSFGTQTVLPNSQYDNGGTLTAITGTKWSCFKFFLNPACGISVQYCQDTWNTLSEATVEEPNERDTYVVNPSLQGFNKFVGLFFFQNNFTATNNTTTGLWQNSGLFGIGIAGSGGGASGVGDVFGPVGSTDNAIARYDGPSGKILQNSVVTISDVGAVATIASYRVDKDGGTAPNSAGGIYLNDSGGNAVGRYAPGIFFGNGGVFHSRLTVMQDDTNLDDNGSLVFETNAGGFANRESFRINYGTAWFYNVVSAASYTTRSDRRLKEDIRDFNLPINFIDNIRPVTFKWKDRDDKSLKVGLIAQEVKEILPSAVGEDKDGNLTIDYSQVTVALIKALKDANERIEELEKWKNKNQ